MNVRVLLGLLVALIAFAAEDESRFLGQVRQLTFEGKRSGEGYFGPRAQFFVFQSEREAGNPFYQIYLTDLDTGDVTRISPGFGKTTCAWIHPKRSRVMFASTHADPLAQQKMTDELALRASGKERRYAWDYDETFDLWSADFEGTDLKQLTHEKGYDAEGSWSPDGTQIVFASNREAYQRALSNDEATIFEHDKSFMIDLYMMDASNSATRKLTDMPGYDGGPFFNADGSQICWRHFSEDGATAEIWVMNSDGSKQRALTKLGAMSWAPYFHPSNQYLIFTTNVHGFANFELYLVSSKGGNPVRITTTDGFDGLPVFSPDGKELAWTSNRTASGASQIFMGAWDHEQAINALARANSQLPASQDAIDGSDLINHIRVLASEDMGGRPTGDEGERLAAEYIAGEYQKIGLKPMGDAGGYFQPFDFKAGVSLGAENRLTVSGLERQWIVDEDWRPLTFSNTGSFDQSPIIFAGYGIVAPAHDELPEYDSYVHLDVKDAWVMVLRFAPSDVDDVQRRQLNRYSSLRFKAMLARERGARGLIVVSGSRSKVESQLVPLRFDAAVAGSGVAAVSVSDELAEQLLSNSAKSLTQLHEQLDAGEPVMGFALQDMTVSIDIDLVHEEKQGLNVLGLIPANLQPKLPAVAVGAHFDHLGAGLSGSSLARKDEQGQTHYGADDNASGVAGMLEIAQYVAAQRAAGKMDSARDLYIMAWSGEELGLLGSSHFVNRYELNDLSEVFAAYLNLDMIGRLKDSLVLQGVGSSTSWPGLIERANVPIGLSIKTSRDSYLPTDATSFYLKKIPILSAFTGAHEDYHTPRDVPDKIQIEGATSITKFMALLTRSLLKSLESPLYVETEKPSSGGERRGIRVYLGTIPDYATGDIKGVKISGVSKEGPADVAGLQGGDVIVALSGRSIENIYDYTYAMDDLKVGEVVEIVIERAGERIVLNITPTSRD